MSINVLLEYIASHRDQFEDPDHAIEFVMHMNPHQSWALRSRGVKAVSLHHDGDIGSGTSMDGLTFNLSSNASPNSVHNQSGFVLELGVFLTSYLQNGSKLDKRTIDDFARMMQEKYNVTVTVYE